MSRREKLRDWLAREFSVISQDNGYRTTPFPVLQYIPFGNKVGNFPQVCIRIGDESLEWLDDPRTRFDTLCDVQVRGYYSDETQSEGDLNLYAGDTAGEPLLHDMKVVFAAIVTKNLTETDSWLISDDFTPQFIGPTPFGVNQGYVEIRFRVRLRVQDSTWE